MNSQENLNLIRRFYEELYNKNNTHIIEQFCAQNITIHDPALPNQKEGLNLYKETENEYKHAFPNKKTRIEEIFATDDRVFVRWTFHGTQKGNLKEITATNKEVKISGLSLYTIKNNKIVEIYQQWDRLGLLEQIGEIQPAEALH